jgi:hypothetical protein
MTTSSPCCPTFATSLELFYLSLATRPLPQAVLTSCSGFALNRKPLIDERL